MGVVHRVKLEARRRGRRSSKGAVAASEQLAEPGYRPPSQPHLDQRPSDIPDHMMQKRVGLARAIATDPEVIFFDEPTTGLDPIMSGVINDLMQEIVEEIGATTITITHDMSSVRAIASRVAMIHGGQVQWHGQACDLDATEDPFLRQFIAGAAEGPIETLR